MSATAMLDAPFDQTEDAVRVGSIYDAALQRSRSSQSEPVPAMPDTITDTHEMTVLPKVYAAADGESSLVPVTTDWSATLGLVERAAATIKAYERRFVQLDVHTRALIERSAEEQARLQEEIRSLEQRLRDVEERASRAEAAGRDEAFYRWEAERRLRETESRLAEAEDYSRQSDEYLRRVHSALADL